MKNLFVADGLRRFTSYSASSFCARIWLAILCALFFVRPSHGASEPPGVKKNVLLLYSNFGLHSGFSDRLEPLVRARVPGDVTFYESYLEPTQLENRPYLKSEAETIRRRFESSKLDLVIPVSYGALEFATQYRDKMFPGVPIVFTGVSASRLQGRIWPGVTGLTVPVSSTTLIE